MGLETFFRTRARIALYFIVLILCLTVIVICITVAVTVTKKDESSTTKKVDGKADREEQTRLWPKLPDDTGNQYRYASVACSEKNCSKIGVKVLAEGGSAVDASIATSLCIGIARPISSGIGGGGFMTFYDRSSKEGVVLDYRETAPKASNATMYVDSDSIFSNIGGGSIAVPGEIAGLWEAHQRYGKLPWSRLFEPSIKLAENGITVNNYLSSKIAASYNQLDDELRNLVTNSDGMMKKEGDTIVFAKLAQTYRRIAEDGVYTFYNGTLKDDIVKDLEELDGQIVTSEDLMSYRPAKRSILKSTISHGNYTVMSLPPPSGGVIVQYILNILNGYKLSAQSVSPKPENIASTATTYHRIIEAMKFAFSMRQNLGDSDYVNVTQFVADMTNPDFGNQIRKRITDDTTHNVEYYGHLTDGRNTTGTSQISVLAGNGDAVSITTSVNYVFGSKRMGKRTGIIFNNLMDDFSMPDKPRGMDDAWVAPADSANWIEPGKRPLSAMSPTIVTDTKGDVILVSGGSGARKIITATTLTFINNLWFKMNLTEAVARPRLHHQLLPNNIRYETGFPQVYLDELKKKNHELEAETFPPVSDSVSREGDVIFGFGDARRLGGADGF